MGILKRKERKGEKRKGKKWVKGMNKKEQERKGMTCRIMMEGEKKGR